MNKDKFNMVFSPCFEPKHSKEPLSASVVEIIIKDLGRLGFVDVLNSEFKSDEHLLILMVFHVCDFGDESAPTIKRDGAFALISDRFVPL